MILLIVGLIILFFGFVVFFGAPYLPTFKRQADEAISLLELEKGQILLELGSGDGRVMRRAAKKGIKVVGYELNPILVIISYFVTYKYRKNVRIIWGNYWYKNWPEADGIYVFLLDNYMPKLDKKIKEYRCKPIKLATFTFEIPGKNPDKTKNGILLYKYK